MFKLASPEISFESYNIIFKSVYFALQRWEGMLGRQKHNIVHLPYYR